MIPARQSAVSPVPQAFGGVDEAPAWAVELRDHVVGLAAQVAGLEAAFERLAPEPKINRVDRLALARLLPPLRDVFEATPFTAGEVLAVSTLLRVVSTEV